MTKDKLEVEKIFCHDSCMINWNEVKRLSEAELSSIDEEDRAITDVPYNNYLLLDSKSCQIYSPTSRPFIFFTSQEFAVSYAAYERIDHLYGVLKIAEMGFFDASNFRDWHRFHSHKPKSG